MAYSFTFERLTFGDFFMLGLIGQRAVLSVQDYINLLGVLNRCYVGSVNDVPVTDLESLLMAFQTQLQAFFAGMQQPAPAPTPAKKRATRKRAPEPEPEPDLATPDADRLLRMLDRLMGGTAS